MLVLIACAAGCGQRTSTPARAETGSLDSAALVIYEAIVPNSKSDPHQTHCLGINGRDPSTKIITTMLASGYVVAPISECTFSIKQQGFHNPTRRPAVFHTIDGLEIFAGVTAGADVSTVIHGLNGSHYRFDLRFTRSKWHIETRQFTGVS